MAEVLSREQGALPKGGKEIIDRATFLPIGQYEDGSLTFAWPGFLKDGWDAAQRSAVAQEGPPVFDDGGKYVSGYPSRPSDPAMVAMTVPLAGIAGRAAVAIPRGALGTGGSDMVTKPKGITAYHGSPHDFDKFSLDKIGTGEGAQAYGHGLYFAEAEPVARMYRDQLSGAIPDDVRGALNTVDNLGFNSPGTALANARAHSDWMTRWDVDPARSSQEAAAAEIINRHLEKPRGRMYEVNIKAEPEQFLDWDKPIGQQASHVRDRLAPFELSDDAKSFNILQGIAEKLRVDNKITPGRDLGMHVSDELRGAGLPGIRYLDQGSRNAGDGTYNYVVFDDNLIDIMRKYANPETASLPYLMQNAEDRPSMSSILRRQ